LRACSLVVGHPERSHHSQPKARYTLAAGAVFRRGDFLEDMEPVNHWSSDQCGARWTDADVQVLQGTLLC
jgi:hypothetical protein